MLDTHQDIWIGVCQKKRKKRWENYGHKDGLFLCLMTGYKNFLTQKDLQIKISLELFHKVPPGAIEMLFDEQNQPLFKRADLGKYLGVQNVKHNFKDFPSHYTRPRSDLKGGGLSSPLGRQKNLHDIVINLDGSTEMAVRSKKTQGS